MKKGKIVLKIGIFIGILGCMAKLFSPIVTQKYDYKTDYAAMEIAEGFYAEPENTLDVLYLGQSYIRNGVSPMEIWHAYGITGYARASSQQPPCVSYYLLKEALNTQSPKVVVYEAATLIDTQTGETNDYDMRENKIHEVIDFMKFGSEKIELAREIVEHSSLSYSDLLLPLYRYHERWADVREEDFKPLGIRPYAYKGQYPSTTISSFDIWEGYMREGGCDEPAVLNDTTAYYVGKMQELCEEKGAALVLVCMPKTIWDDNRHRIVSEYAESRGLLFLDYCTEELRTEIKFNPKTDSGDGGAHLNMIGAEKVSKHLGSYLQEQFQLEDKRGDAKYAGWNENYRIYTHEQLAKEVIRETNLSDFLDLVNQPNYLVIAAAKSDVSLYFTDEIYQKMQRLGFRENLSKIPYESYIGIAQGGDCLYEKSAANEALNHDFTYGEHYISVMSDSRRGANSQVSIQVDGKEESTNLVGLNFIVYDTELDRIITAKRFNIGNTGRSYTEKIQFPKNTALEEFLRSAVADRYVVVLSAKAGEDSRQEEEYRSILERYGVEADGRGPYLAVWDGGSLMFQKTGGEGEKVCIEQDFSGIAVRAESGNAKNTIQFNGEMVKLQEKEWNFAVYDKYAGRIAGALSYGGEELKKK